MLPTLHRAFRCLTSYKFYSNEETIARLFEKTLSDPSSKELDNQNALAYEPLKNVPKSKKRKLKRNKVEHTTTSYMVPVESTAFSHLVNLHPKLKIRLNSAFEKILPIQEMVLPHALHNKSVLIQSETGSGKTIAFAAPVVNALLKGQLHANSRCLILCPSKQLCDQIHRVILSMVSRPSCAVALKSKGYPALKQNEQIVEGVPVIISTPATLNGKLQKGILKLSDISMVVIDECDRLYQEDFESQVNHIIVGLSRKKDEPQYLVSSATVSPEMKGLLKSQISDLVVIESGNITPAALLHRCVLAPTHRRTETLLHLLAENSDEQGYCKKCIIFVQKKEICSGINEVLQNAGYYSTTIHGDMPETQRNYEFNQYRDGKYDIIIATDIIARGIDIPDCQLTIQIQPRVEVPMYLHRAGRAARAGKAGTSYLVMCEGDLADRHMVQEIRGAVQLDMIDSRDFLPKEPSGIKSVLESSLQNVTTSNELAFSIDIQMEDKIDFYHQLVDELNIRPINTVHVKDKNIFGMWFSSPVEAWSAERVLQHYFKENNMPTPQLGVYRHKHRNKAVIDWDSYFNNIRQQRKEDQQLRYKNLVKAQMGAKRVMRMKRPGRNK